MAIVWTTALPRRMIVLTWSCGLMTSGPRPAQPVVSTITRAYPEVAADAAKQLTLPGWAARGGRRWGLGGKSKRCRCPCPALPLTACLHCNQSALSDVGPEHFQALPTSPSTTNNILSTTTTTHSLESSTSTTQHQAGAAPSVSKPAHIVKRRQQSSPWPLLQHRCSACGRHCSEPSEPPSHHRVPTPPLSRHPQRPQQQQQHHHHHHHHHHQYRAPQKTRHL